MKIGIVGAGFTGLSAALRLLKNNHQVTIFEKDNYAGGLAIGFKLPHWDWSLEQHYHHWFANDKDVLILARELNYPTLIKRPKTSIYLGRTIFQMDSLYHVLTFPKLSPAQRVRMAAVLGFLKVDPFWKSLEKYKASEVLPILMGEKSYNLIWEPQLDNKFGKNADEISLAWFWARIRKRTSRLAYPQKGFFFFAKHICDEIQKQGGIIFFNADVLKISNAGKATITWSQGGKEKSETFDKVIVTLPSHLFAKKTPSLPKEYQEKITKLKGLGAINLVLRLRKTFLENGTYWLSICEKNSKVTAVVEHTNFMDPKNYGNEHLVYLGNYLPQDHKYFKMDENQLLKEFDPFLIKLNKNYKKNLIAVHKFNASFAQPIIPTNY